jgi:hypothetical protein
VDSVTLTSLTEIVGAAFATALGARANTAVKTAAKAKRRIRRGTTRVPRRSPLITF